MLFFLCYKFDQVVLFESLYVFLGCCKIIIEERVEIDEGNSYVPRSYKWVVIGDEGGTQLHLEFDTVICE